FASVDPGERRLAYSGEELARQVPYVADVVESTLQALARMPNVSAAQLEAGLADLRGLPAIQDAALGWDVHKATAVR
ncbi:MAG TPA: hypothetical protein VH572_07245, partial [Gaiella sp.]